MSRIGEIMRKVPAANGAANGKNVWCDTHGDYSVDDEVGQANFFFHQESVRPNGLIQLRCKKHRR